jgi:hypothetical protein
MPSAKGVLLELARAESEAERVERCNPGALLIERADSGHGRKRTSSGRTWPRSGRARAILRGDDPGR